MKIKPQIDKAKTKWFAPKQWEFRKNTARKEKNKSHPSLVVGENKNTFANLGLTHAKMRGHHKNIQLSSNPNPNDKKISYIRDDMQYDDKQNLKEVLKDYKSLSKTDVNKVQKLIKKKISTRR